MPSVTDSTAALLRRLRTATFFFVLVVLMGSVGYYLIGRGHWTLFDCFYMTLITLSTVGYGEVLLGMEKLVEARILTASLIVLGSGTLVYFVSTITAFIVEGDLQGILRRRSMARDIDKISGHAIVCGVGSTGRHVVNELLASGHPCVIVDLNQAAIEELESENRRTIPHVIGSAIDDHVLQRAGIERAAIVVAALTDDKENLFVTITARAFNPTARIVAKCVEPTTEPKLLRAGATNVVSPNYIGGMRMASEVLRPSAVAFLDRMLRDQGDKKMRIEELVVAPGRAVEGRALADTSIRNQGALVLAVRTASGEFIYNPPGSLRIEAGMALIILASIDDVKKLRDALESNALA